MTGHPIIRFLAAVLLTVSLPVFADAGAFQFVSGEVKIVRPDGREVVAAKGAKILEGDTIVTGTNGNAQLLMADEALISLRPDSTLRFDTYRYAGREDGSEKGILGLLKGGFRTLTGLIGRANKNNYLVRTPTATIGIRGTDHEPFYIPPAGWSGAPGADPGTYNKVNSGETFLQTEGGRIELGTNQVGFVPPSPQAQPTRLDRVPDFMRPTPMLRGHGQGDRRGPGDRPGRGDRRGPPPPGGGQMPPPPPGGQMPPRSGDIPLFFEPLAAGGSFGFNQAISDLNEAPLGSFMTGGDRSANGVIGNGSGKVEPGGLLVLVDPSNNIALVQDTAGNFQYARSSAPLINGGGAVIMDGTTAVPVRWGIYAGGAIIDTMGPRAVEYFHFSGAGQTPAVMPSNMTYTVVVGSTKPIAEVGPPGGSVTSVDIRIDSLSKLSKYDISVVDALGRNWATNLSGGPVTLDQFAKGPGGASLGGNCTPCGGTTLSLDTSKSYATGGPVGPTGQGLLSAYTLRTVSGNYGVTGSLAVKP